MITEKQRLYMIMHTTRNMVIIVIAEKVENRAKKRATETLYSTGLLVTLLRLIGRKNRLRQKDRLRITIKDWKKSRRQVL